MTVDRFRPGRMSSRKARAAATGIGIALTTGASALVNLLTSSFNWTVAVILIMLVLVTIAVAVWERFCESADLPSARTAGEGPAEPTGTSLTQEINQISPNGEVIGIDTAGDLPPHVPVRQWAGTVDGHLTGIRIGRPETRQ
jgi:hypothetical protein